MLVEIYSVTKKTIQIDTVRRAYSSVTPETEAWVEDGFYPEDVMTTDAVDSSTDHAEPPSRKPPVQEKFPVSRRAIRSFKDYRMSRFLKGEPMLSKSSSRNHGRKPRRFERTV